MRSRAYAAEKEEIRPYRRYLSKHIHFSLGEGEIEGLRLFYAKARQHYLIDRCRQLRFSHKAHMSLLRSVHTYGRMIKFSQHLCAAFALSEAALAAAQVESVSAAAWIVVASWCSQCSHGV